MSALHPGEDDAMQERRDFATPAIGGGWPLSPWMPQLAELAAAHNLADYWKRLSVLLGRLMPYRTAIAWNDWSTDVFGETPSPFVAEAEPSMRDAWRNYLLAAATLHFSGERPPGEPFALKLMQSGAAEQAYRQLFRPSGWEHALVIPFRRGGIVRAGITLFRNAAQGPFDSNASARLREMYPLLEALARRVLEHEQHRAVQSSVLNVLGNLPVGLLLLDWELKPIFGNSEGYRQTQRWNRLSAATTGIESKYDFHLPDALLAACDSLRQQWATEVFSLHAYEDDPRREVAHPQQPGLKAAIEIPPSYRGGTGLPSFLIRYAGMAARSAEPHEPTSAQLAVLAQLTPGERNVALLVMQGKSNREIAAQLHREVSTVKDHLSNIYSKLGIQNRTQLAGLFAP
ncbi:LuxR C-terminal-related transcriptional regulator [Rudaea sp. 3F27F6]|nr:LuxR C-terminal-related transcriptional regulator [Rudaea sp. 3F27F6]